MSQLDKSQDQPFLPEQQVRSQSDLLTQVGAGGSSPILSHSLPPELLAALMAEARFKDRSEQTHVQVHTPVLHIKQPIELLLIGDSMFERLKTTGRDTVLGVAKTAYPGVFNAGVGGDKIRNVVYRLVREQGLLECLRECDGSQYIFLEVGTNDLGDGKWPLKPQDIQVYRLMIEALTMVCAPQLKALVVCGLNLKKKIKKDGVVEKSNVLLQDLVREMQRNSSKSGPVIEYLDADEKVIQCLEEDGVHLNEKGYEIFAQRLWEKYEELRTRLDTISLDSEASRPCEIMAGTTYVEISP